MHSDNKNSTKNVLSFFDEMVEQLEQGMGEIDKNTAALKATKNINLQDLFTMLNGNFELKDQLVESENTSHFVPIRRGGKQLQLLKEDLEKRTTRI